MRLSLLVVAASSCTSFHCGAQDVMRNGTATVGAVVGKTADSEMVKGGRPCSFLRNL
jgi:hypothetical protein